MNKDVTTSEPRPLSRPADMPLTFETVTMRKVRELMRPAKAWIDPDQTVETAIILMRGHHLVGLPVVEAGKVLGVIEQSALVDADPRRPISEYAAMRAPVIDPEMPVKMAARTLAEARLSCLPVVDGDGLQGMISVFDLLPEIGRSYDPMTGCPWSDTLREWCIERLAMGDEVTVIFFDMDQFGAFNKRYGHVVGDEVLRIVANVIQAEVDQKIELLCRYGGDEFAMATLRRSEEAGLLAHQIVRLISAIRLPEVDMPISITYGYHGGKRTREREHVHYAATVDNLINLASRHCLEAKGLQSTGPQMALPLQDPSMVEQRVRLQGLNFVRDGHSAKVQVRLGAADETAYGAAEGTRDPMELVAEATLNALSKLLPQGHTLTLNEVAVSEMGTGRALANVVIHWQGPDSQKELVGAALATEDRYRAVAMAALDAINRPLSANLIPPHRP